MRIGIVSDFHGNLRGLEAVLADVEAVRPDLVVHGGDLAFNGPRPAEVVDRIRELGWPGIVGNTDEAVWAVPEWLPDPVREAFERRTRWTGEKLGEERVDWLRTLPREWRLQNIALVHAVPANLWEAVPKEAPDDRLRAVFGPLGARLAVYCHVHTPFVRDLGDLTVANSGSAGAPYDGDTRPSWLLVDDGVPAVRRVDYDVEAAAAELRASGYPDGDDVAEALVTATFHAPGSRR